MSSRPGELYRTTDGGEHWSEVASSGGFGPPADHGLPFAGLISFRDALIGWIGGGQGGAFSPEHPLYLTEDGGRTWQARSSLPGTGPAFFLIAKNWWAWRDEADSSGLAAPARGKLYRSSEGANWTALAPAGDLAQALDKGEKVRQLDFVALAASPIKLIVNGQEILPDVPPQLINGRTLVPVRWVAEALGAEVEWDAGAGAVFVKSENEPSSLLQRLRSLEPAEPERVADDWQAEQVRQFLTENQLAEIATIRSQGQEVPFAVVAADDTWTRPAYAAEWHSTFMAGKYSNVSQLVSYARRNLFVYTGGLSEGAGLLYSLGFGEDWGKPVFGPGPLYREAFELLSLSGKVREIYRLNNEWLVVWEPQLQGYQTVRVNYADAGMEVGEKTTPQLQLFRVVTPDGYELERTAQNLPAM